ncbi:hypothetical protein P3H80_00980 [Mycolicibacterium septicum]|uniref:hypothetical protein n=1 Tax=Mycolicibacterium septicum TaxID=98668 RepID=UPI0023E256BC|nr:hypothetical protein [Mycolicibacterium septicum]MDF3335972.1 hypothetical protein [Mycolicibacterium septicum]
MAESAEQAVIWAGGLICDGALAGWQVVVWLPEVTGSAALTILGAEARGAGPEVAIAETGAPLVRIAPGQAGAGQLQTYLCDRSDLGGAATGRASPQAVVDGVLHHRLSFAARAFKAQALTACGRPGPVREVETFRPTDLRWSIGPSAGRTVTTQVQ